MISVIFLVESNLYSEELHSSLKQIQEIYVIGICTIYT